MNDMREYWFGDNSSIAFRLLTFAALVGGVLISVVLDLPTLVGIAVVLLMIVAVQVAVTTVGRRNPPNT